MQSEEIFDGAIREVKEETGVIIHPISLINDFCLETFKLITTFSHLQIDTTFLEMVAFRSNFYTFPTHSILMRFENAWPEGHLE